MSSQFGGFSIPTNLITLFLNFDNCALGVIVSLAASSGMSRSGLCVNRQRRRPVGPKIAALCALITTVLLFGAAAIGLELEGESLQDIASEGLLFMYALIVANLGVNILVIRLGTWLSSRSNIKRA